MNENQENFLDLHVTVFFTNILLVLMYLFFLIKLTLACESVPTMLSTIYDEGQFE